MALEVEMLTLDPPTGAGPVSVIVPTAFPATARVEGAMASDEITTGTGWTVRVTGMARGVLDAPAMVMVITAL